MDNTEEEQTEFEIPLWVTNHREVFNDQVKNFDVLENVEDMNHLKVIEQDFYTTQFLTEFDLPKFWKGKEDC